MRSHLSAKASTNSGNTAWSGRTIRLNTPPDNITRSNPNIGWSHAPERQWERGASDRGPPPSRLHPASQAEQPATLTVEEEQAIRRLATAIPAFWQTPTTTAADRQAIVRQLLERVVITVRGESEQVEAQIHWLGGYATQATLIRPVARLDQLSYYPQLVARVIALHAAGEGPSAIARQLNAEGWHPAKRCETFNAAMVGDLETPPGAAHFSANNVFPSPQR
jgi:hypothetical protein